MFNAGLFTEMETSVAATFGNIFFGACDVLYAKQVAKNNSCKSLKS